MSSNAASLSHVPGSLQRTLNALSQVAPACSSNVTVSSAGNTRKSSATAAFASSRRAPRASTTRGVAQLRNRARSSLVGHSHGCSPLARSLGCVGVGELGAVLGACAFGVANRTTVADFEGEADGDSAVGSEVVATAGAPARGSIVREHAKLKRLRKNAVNERLPHDTATEVYIKARRGSPEGRGASSTDQTATSSGHGHMACRRPA